MTAARPVDAAFTKRLPKIELHAHLSGSISRQSLHETWSQLKAETPAFSLEDPLTAMPSEKVDYDINTFFPLFSTYIHHLITTLPALTSTTHSVLSSFAHDSVIYAELRTTPRAQPSFTKAEYVSTILDCIASPGHSPLTCALILSIDRSNTAAEAMEVVDLAVRYRARGVVGVDLCGNPARGDVGIYRDAFARAKAEGLGVTLHFAEVVGRGGEEELWTLLGYGPDRIGHVIHVSDEVKREIIGRRVGLELCLSCNVHAKLIEGGIGDHHLRWWRGKGCPIALCTDDVGVFCSPLSNEFLLAAEHFKLSRRDLVELCNDSVGMIFGDDEQKRRLRSLLATFEKEENLTLDA